MRLLRDNTVAVCVDYQEKLMPAIKDAETVLNNAEKLIKGLKVLGVPVLVTQQYTKGLGGTVEPVHGALGEYEPYDKLCFGAYDEDEFKKLVDETGRRSVLVFGTETHICVLQTALGLKEAGFDVIFVDDCCGSRKDSDKESGLRRAMCEGVRVSSLELVLFELTKVAGNEMFKAISKLVK